MSWSHQFLHPVFVVVQDVHDPTEEPLHRLIFTLLEVVEIRDDELGGVVSAAVAVEVSLNLITVLSDYSSDLHTAVPVQSKTPE